MGRKATITKEIILKTAFDMLLKDGYAAINVKTLAAEIGCSTQPIVWHFENMDGFRDAFLEYCVTYAKTLFTVWYGSLDDLLAETARVYITIACNTPNLFRFIFIDSREVLKNTGTVLELQSDNTQRITDLLRWEKGLSESQVQSFLTNYEIYIHGLASYIAAGFYTFSEEDLIRMTLQAKDAFLSHLSSPSA